MLLDIKKRLICRKTVRKRSIWPFIFIAIEFAYLYIKTKNILKSNDFEIHSVYVGVTTEYY